MAMHRVPYEWQHVVCICPEDEGTKHNLDESIYMLCIKCSKFKRFYASYCSHCREFYVMVFNAGNRWTPLSNWCWNCLWAVEVANHDPDCGVYITCLQSSQATPPPERVKPRVRRTKEEIEADLDDFFGVVESRGSASIDFDF